MGTVNFLNQMAEFNFNAPIGVEIIFEDSDDDDPSYQNALNKRDNINDDNNNKQDKISSENQVNDRCLNKSMLSLNKNNRILKKNPCKDTNGNQLNNCENAEIRNNTNYVGHYHNQNTFDASQACNDTVINNEESLPSPRQRNNLHEPVTTFIEDLNKLSEHIVHIMQSFYLYVVNKTNEDNEKRKDIFHIIKSHFFELSYTTVESIFLPKEQNESFIHQFLDNTVLLANSKSFPWKCHKGHVLPFFKELLTWTKQKKKHQHIENNRIPRHSNGNIMLIQQLMRTLSPLNFPQSEIVANSNIATQKSQNNLCIFSSGTPGNEISINIDADTLTQINERQQCITAERNKKHSNFASSCEATRRKSPVSRPTYGNRVKDIQKNNPKYGRPPPPYYNVNHSSKILPYRPQQYDQINVNTNQIYYNNMRQRHQDIGQPILSYPTKVQYINTNQTSPSVNNNVNYMTYDNKTNNIPMHGMEMDNEVTSSPVITNVCSLNPKTRILYVRCYMCGKTASRHATQYDSYNLRRTPFYCSYLCQELDIQFYQPAAWGNT